MIVIVEHRINQTARFFYLFFIVIFTLIFSIALTNIICLGKFHEHNFYEVKKKYIVVFSLWLIFFLTIGLILGSAGELDNTVDKVVFWYKLNSGEWTYAVSRMEDNEKGYPEYYVKADARNVNLIIIQIVKSNSFIYKYHRLGDITVCYFTDGRKYGVYDGDNQIATVYTRNEFMLKKLIFSWNNEKMEKIMNERGGPNRWWLENSENS
ncbi:MAG: hypothetical protein ACI4CX_05185 [Candidatus Weimeria sp.]